MNKNIEIEIEKLKPDLLNAIKRMVAIESVKSEPEKDAPFGVGPKKALDEALKIASELGFDVVNIDNKVGYAQYGEGKGPYLGIFGHVDVVPLGEGWVHDPLGGEIKEGRMFGRGVLDNKGPTMINLFALYTMKLLDIKFPVPIRMVFGTNEETGFECIKHYLSKENPPIFGWTPDCKWPVIYGESGRGKVRLINKGTKEEFYKYLNNYIFSSSTNGIKLGINYKDEDFGELVMRDYQLGIDAEGNDFFQLSLSYPDSTSIEEISKQIKSTCPRTILYEVIDNWDPVLYDKDSKYVRILQDTYEKYTGLDGTPETTIGGTYAKLVPNIIAYGPSFPGQKDIAHLPDEWMDLEDIMANAKIYALALYGLKNFL